MVVVPQWQLSRVLVIPRTMVSAAADGQIYLLSSANFSQGCSFRSGAYTLGFTTYVCNFPFFIDLCLLHCIYPSAVQHMYVGVPLPSEVLASRSKD